MGYIDWSEMLFGPYESDREMLTDLYISKAWSLRDIARKLGVTRKTVAARLRSFGVSIRPRGQPSKELVAVEVEMVLSECRVGMI